MGNNVTLIPKQPARHSLLTNVENVVYMPLASRHSHGIVKIGEGLNITADGLLSVDVNSEWYTTIRDDVDQLKVSVQDLKTDVDTALMDVSDINEKLSDIENGTKLISVYQTKQDSGLVTINKTVVGGINELKNQTTLNINNIESVKNDLTGVKRDYATLRYVDDLYSNISMGGSKSYVFETRVQFIAWLDDLYEREDSFKPELLNIGDIVLIEEMGVPDYWVKSKSSPMTINDFREYEAKIDIPEVKVDDSSINKNTQGELQTIAIKHGRLIVGDTVSKSDFKGWIELKSVEQFKQLVEYGSIVVDGETIVYDENGVYVTPEPYADEFVTLELFEQLQSNVSELTPKVRRALLTPMSAPTETKIVAVDNTNSQELLGIGTGLEKINGNVQVEQSVLNDVENNKEQIDLLQGDIAGKTNVTINNVHQDYINFSSDPQTQLNNLNTNKANKSETKVYAHYVTLISWEIKVVIITDNNTPFTYSSLAQYLYNNNFRENNGSMGVFGMRSNGAQWLPRSGIYSNNGTRINVVSSTGGAIADEIIGTSVAFEDKIISIN